MIVYLLRHGIAVNLGEQGTARDEERMLAPEGARKTRLALAGLAALGCRPGTIYSSPLERAVETAAPIAAAHKLEVRVTRPELLVRAREIYVARQP